MWQNRCTHRNRDLFQARRHDLNRRFVRTATESAFIQTWNSSFSDLKKQFESPPYSVSVEAGQSTELRCLPPVGVPPPRVYWLRNNIPVDTESDTLLVSSEGHLLVGQAKLSHQANYTCVAENIAAKRLSEPVGLTVYGEFTVMFTLRSHDRRLRWLWFHFLANLSRLINLCIFSHQSRS